MTHRRLGIVLHDYSGHPFQIQLARELARRGHRVHHCYSSSIQTPQGALVARTSDPPTLSISPITLGTPLAKYTYVRRWMQERRYGSLLSARIAEHSPDVVISSNAPPGVQAATLRAIEARATPLVFWLQDLYGEAAKRLLPARLPGIGWVAAQWLAAIERHCLRRSAAIVSISDDFGPFLRGMGIESDRCTTIENWAPLDEIAPTPKLNAWSAAHDCSEGFTFLYAGTLGLKHNPELLAVLAKALEARPACRLIVASEGLGADYLARQKEKRWLNRLVLLPFQPYDSLADMLGSADVTIALLEPDAGVFSVPSKVLTYFSAGRPLLAAMPARNLAARLIGREKAGIVVDPGDAKEFIAAAMRFIDRPLDVAAMGRKARSYAERTFGIGPIADRFESILFKHLI